MIQALNRRAVAAQHRAAGANLHLLVETTGFGGHVVAEQGEGAGPASPGIVQAGLSGPQAAVHADADALLFTAGGREGLVLQPLMDGGHDLLPHGHCRVIAGADALRVVIAHPDRGGIVGSIAHKPLIVIGVGGTGLAGHRHT